MEDPKEDYVILEVELSGWIAAQEHPNMRLYPRLLNACRRWREEDIRKHYISKFIAGTKMKIVRVVEDEPEEICEVAPSNRLADDRELLSLRTAEDPCASPCPS